MTSFLILTLVFCFVLANCYIQSSADTDYNPYVEALRSRPWKSVQQYVEVRKGAHIFYWFYYADGTRAEAERKPLVIWIQGGPGLAASGIGNFAEIGPLNMDMKPRNHTWVKGRNILLIDHPVGTGFSYVTNTSLLVTTDRNIALDLAKVIKVFLKRHKMFRTTPTYIFGQSYGGKMSPRLAWYLHNGIQKKRLQMNLKGIGIGSGWVDPKESTLIQPGFLYSMGVIDQSTYIKTKTLAKQMSSYIEKKEYAEAGIVDSLIFDTLNIEAGMEINFNNINQISPYPALSNLAVKIKKYVVPTLAHVVNQSIEWKYMSDNVWHKLSKNFLVPSSKFLETLLNQTNLKIAVYNGNLDVVTPLAGASNWVHKLKWPGAEEFKVAKRVQIRGDRNGFYKEARQLSFWSVFGSGHWVPEDNPVAMQQILEYMMGET